MNKIIRLLVITLPIIFCSCDFHTKSTLINSTKSNVVVEIHYDKDSIKKDWRNKSFYSLFVEKDLQKKKFIKVDTLNLIIDIKVIPKDTFQIDVNWGKKPTFQYIKNIKIFGKDTIILQNREKMKKVFQKQEDGKFVFEIR